MDNRICFNCKDDFAKYSLLMQNDNGVTKEIRGNKYCIKCMEMLRNIQLLKRELRKAGYDFNNRRY